MSFGPAYDGLVCRTKHRNTRRKCNCDGYHFPHRLGGGACQYGLRRDYYRAVSQGMLKEEALTLLSAAALETMPL